MSGGIKVTMGPAEWLTLLVFAGLWGGSFVFTAYGLQHWSFLTFSGGRLAASAVMLYVILRLAGRALPRDIATWRDFMIMGGLNLVVPLILISWAQRTLPPGLTSILIASTPFVTILAAQALTRDEKITGGKVAGVVLGFLGVAVLIGISLLAEAGAHVVAELALLVAALFYGLSSIYGRRFARMGVDMMVGAAGQQIGGALLMVPIVLVFDPPWAMPAPTPAAWLVLISAGFFANVLAPLLFFRLLSTTGATNAMLASFLAPVFSILISALLLGERLQAKHVWGMTLIALGLAAIDGRPWRALQRRLRREPA